MRLPPCCGFQNNAWLRCILNMHNTACAPRIKPSQLLLRHLMQDLGSPFCHFWPEQYYWLVQIHACMQDVATTRIHSELAQGSYQPSTGLVPCDQAYRTPSSFGALTSHSCSGRTMHGVLPLTDLSVKVSELLLASSDVVSGAVSIFSACILPMPCLRRGPT